MPEQNKFSACNKCYVKTRNVVALPKEPKIEELKELAQYKFMCMKCLRRKYKGYVIGQ